MRVNASPSTASIPEYLVTKPRESMQRIAARAGIIRRTDLAKQAQPSSSARGPSKAPLVTAATKHGRARRTTAGPFRVGPSRNPPAAESAWPVTAVPLATFR